MSDRGLDQEELGKLLRAGISAGEKRGVDPQLLDGIRRLAERDAETMSRGLYFLARLLSVIVEVETRLTVGERTVEISRRQQHDGWN